MELNWLDYGARMRDPAMVPWMVPDPMAEMYYSTSPYMYCLGNPMNNIDPDGMRVVSGDSARMNQLVADLNRIYADNYKNKEDAFSMKYNDDTGSYEIFGNDTFDWNSDDYSKAMKDIIDDDNVITVKFQKYNDKGQLLLDPKNPDIFGMGGGYVDGKTMYLSTDLSNYGEAGTKGKFAYKWTKGGVFLHEGIYHLHDLGLAEQGKMSNKYMGTPTYGPNIMRARYNTMTGKDHNAGKQQIIRRRR
jgi:hypothetical protein